MTATPASHYTGLAQPQCSTKGQGIFQCVVWSSEHRGATRGRTLFAFGVENLLQHLKSANSRRARPFGCEGRNGRWGVGGASTCLVVASVEQQGVGEGSHSPTGEVEHCCSHPVDAPLHWDLQATKTTTSHQPCMLCGLLAHTFALDGPIGRACKQ